MWRGIERSNEILLWRAIDDIHRDEMSDYNIFRGLLHIVKALFFLSTPHAEADIALDGH